MTLIVITQYFILVFVYSRNPFPPGEKVVSKGSQYACQQCSAKETRSDVRGPKLESKSSVRYILPACGTFPLIMSSTCTCIIQFIMAGKSLKTSHEPPRGKGDRHPAHWINSGKTEGRKVDHLKVRSCGTFTVKDIAAKAVSTSQSKSTWNPGACTYQKHGWLSWEWRHPMSLPPLNEI